jgi:hypothetical protein
MMSFSSCTEKDLTTTAGSLATFLRDDTVHFRKEDHKLVGDCREQTAGISAGFMSPLEEEARHNVTFGFQLLAQ